MIEPIQFPEMRSQVRSALESLSDPSLQARWGQFEKDSYFDDLTLNVNILYDDAMVLPDPASAVPQILFQAEVGAFRALGQVLGELLASIGDQADEVYLGDPRWPLVLQRAAIALAAMCKSDDESQSHAPREASGT